MTVFKTFLKILYKNKFIVLLYTGILLLFSVINTQTSEQNLNFVATKPDIKIINNDVNEGITKDLIKYLENNHNIIDIASDENAIKDALFYRDVNYVIYIPDGFNEDFMNGKDIKLEVQSTGDYQASLAEMNLQRYMKVARIYQNTGITEAELISKINDTLAKDAKIQVTSKLDTSSLSKAATYFNFESYSLLACLIYVICLILSTFNNAVIKKRILISSIDYKKNNQILFLANLLYAVCIWFFFVVLSLIFVGNVMFSMHGLIMIVNALIFTLCATTMAFLISSLVQNKDAINGIVNVVALGSSFLCGAFIPAEWLPDYVLKIAHILPTYYYIDSNNIIANLETINLNTLKPVLYNSAIIILFSIVFIILTNVVTKKKRKIG